MKFSHRSLVPFLALFFLLCAEARALDLFRTKKEPRGSGQAALLRQEMMDFSDAYTLAIGQAIDKYLRGEPDPQKRLAAETWKTLFTAAAMTIAAGQDPSSNLLDMYVFMKLTAQATKQYWVPEVFGEKAAGMNRAYVKLTGELEATMQPFVDAAQKEELDAMIARWREANAGAVYVAGIRLRDLAAMRARRTKVEGGPLPLLSEVQKAVGQADAALQVADRMMFYLERMPQMMSMQTSLALAQAGAAPALISMTESAETASQALDALPQALNDSMAANAATLKDILPDIRSSLEATKEVLASAERLAAPGSEGSSWTKDDVLLALEGLTTSSREINSTLAQAEQLLDRAAEPNSANAFTSLANELQDSGRIVVDTAFYRGLQLLLLFLAAQAVMVWVVLKSRRKDRHRNSLPPSAGGS